MDFSFRSQYRLGRRGKAVGLPRFPAALLYGPLTAARVRSCKGRALQLRLQSEYLLSKDDARP